MLVESFLGVVFGGVCVTISVMKARRAQGQATVLFSWPLVVRFGSGLLVEEEYEDEKKIGAFPSSTIPCPIIEFRVVNTAYKEDRSEIMDAKVTCVSCIDVDAGYTPLAVSQDQRTARWSERSHHSSQLIPSFHSKGSDTATIDTELSESLELSKTWHGPSQISSKPHKVLEYSPRKTATFHSERLETFSNNSKRPGSEIYHSWYEVDRTSSEPKQRRTTDDFTDRINNRKKHKENVQPQIWRPWWETKKMHDDIHVDEGTAAADVSEKGYRKIFSKVKLQNPDHPIFGRTWFLKHVLDENSPLLTREARRQIKLNGGYWPATLNSHKGIRDSLNTFSQIIVSMKGVHNLSGNLVHAQKIYSFIDLVVGYQFVPMRQRSQEKDERDIVLRLDYLNDVIEQHGNDKGEILLGDFRNNNDDS